MKKTLALLMLLAGLAMEARAEYLTWNGSDGHMTWNMDSENLNWLSGSTQTAYTNGSYVAFGDTGFGEVTLVGELAPKQVWVNNSTGADYIFSGEGGMTGDFLTLTKYGAGRLTINTANSFHETNLNAGTLVLGNAGALGSGYVTLNGGTLDLGNQTISNKVEVKGNASIGNGTLNGDLTVGMDATLTLCGDLAGAGWVSPTLNATLNLGGKTLSNVVMLSYAANIGNGTLNGKVFVNKTLTVFGETYIGEACTLIEDGTISLADTATLDLGGKALSNVVELQGNASIGNGTINGSNLIVSAGKTLTLCGDLGGLNRLILNNNSTLNLNGNTLSKSVYLNGSASIGNGTLNKDYDVDVASDTTLTLCGDMKGDGWILLGSGSTLNLNGKTLSNTVVLKGDVRIGNGTLNGNLTMPADAVTPGKTIAFFGETHLNGGTITDGAASIKALKEENPGLLKELSVSEGLIAGTDRQASLADGLEISMSGNLGMENLILTDNNRISVGDGHTITLNNVTIRISNGIYSQVATGEYIFLLNDLFHCSVDMTDVTFDASELSLPEGFNPATDSISFDLGDAKLTTESAGRDITLLMGGYGSRTMSINGYGRPVFTALVPTPEPTTGTLSLLGLCALTARRRKK